MKTVSIDKTLWFGIYKGTKISEAPEDYIGWCIEKEIFSLGDQDDYFKESLRSQRALDEALFDYNHGNAGDR